MPVRSLNSSVLRWPDRDTVDRAVRVWARKLSETWPQLERLGYFGSYARGDWGVASDLDLVAVVRESDAPFERRSPAGLEALPVPAQILVYTEPEWRRLHEADTAFARTLARETVWVYARDATARGVGGASSPRHRACPGE